MSGRIALEHDDLAFGYAIGKAHALAEWQHRREKREFAKLCARFKFAKWYREVKAEGGDRWERLLERSRAQTREKNRKRDEAKAEAFDRTPRQCPGCPAVFVPEFRAGPPRVYCTAACGLRHWRSQNRADQNTKQNARRAKARARNPGALELVCDCCGALFEHAAGKGGRVPVYCSKACSSSAHYRRAQERAGKPVRPRVSQRGNACT